MHWTAAVIWSIVAIGFAALLIRLLQKAQKERRQALRENYPSNRRIPDSSFVEGHEELRFLKSLQWNIVSYCLLIIGALVGVATIVQIKSSEVFSYAILIIGLVDCLAGIYLILEIQHNLRMSRITIFKNKKAFKSNHYWMTPKQLDRQKRIDARLLRDPRLLALFTLAILIGYVILVYILFGTLNPCKIFA
jgi:hypothetical protein